MEARSLEGLDQVKLARYVVEVLRRTMLHYGIWFNEIVHQLGLEEAIRVEQEVSASLVPTAMKRLARSLGFQTTEDGLPLRLVNMEKEELVGLIDALSVNWLANDGLWFQVVENNHDMYTGKRCNDTCWTRYSPVEAAMIKSFLELPEQSGLGGLEQALRFRLYARINEQTSERSVEGLTFRMVKCRVQEARKRKGLPDYPCKSAGVVEYQTFASTIDSRIKTECIGCPPDEHPESWACAWGFYIPG
ncbi:MAG: cytosolic protein [Dehalococcoidia bacterium]|nr:cytosolic protein [Dehalococcoidia bacterium]